MPINTRLEPIDVPYTIISEAEPDDIARYSRRRVDRQNAWASLKKATPVLAVVIAFVTGAATGVWFVAPNWHDAVRRPAVLPGKPCTSEPAPYDSIEIIDQSYSSPTPHT